MKLTYEVQQNYNTVKATDAEGKEWFIPIDASNADYQAYLEAKTK